MQRRHLLAHLQRAGHDDDGHMRQQFLEPGQKIQSEFAFRQHVVQHEQMRRVAPDLGQRLAAVFHADQFVLRQRLLVDFKLEVIVFNDQDDRWIHGNWKKTSNIQHRTPNVQ